MQAIAHQHGREALVIIDNIHLAEGLAHKLHLAWREDGQPVRLLLQGRFTQRGADRRGHLSPLEEFKNTALVLEVMSNDLAGVLQRLVRRAPRNHFVPAIPPAVLDQWLKVFGGELIAFSSAARRKLPQIVRGQYQLTEADAADYIRDEYLKNEDPKRRISNPELENLLAIAACADWELSMPAEGLLHPPGSALAVSMRRGLVWQHILGRFGQFMRYSLCHPGMGKLLWSAARPEKSRLDYACELSQRYPIFGFFVANRLLRGNGDRDGAKRVLTSAVSSANAFEQLIENGMVRLRAKCRQLTELGILSEDELNRRLAACENLAESALATPLPFFQDFLEYAQRKLPTVWRALAEALAQCALATPLSDLANFLEYTQRKLPTVWQAPAEALAKGENRQTLAQSALATPLSDLANFLEYTQRKLPTVWQALAEALAKGENHQTLVQSALATPLRHLANFLEYAQRKLPENPQTNVPVVWQALAEALAKGENRQTPVQSALATRLSHLANFLEYTQRKLPEDSQTNVPVVWQALAQCALTTPLSHLANFLEYAQTNLPTVWQALAKALAQCALTTPLHDLASSLRYAQTNLPTVWQALATELERDRNVSVISQTAKNTDSANLTSFLAYATTALPNLAKSVKAALAEDTRQ